jgi:hypothetical protein
MATPVGLDENGADQQRSSEPTDRERESEQQTFDDRLAKSIHFHTHVY